MKKTFILLASVFALLFVSSCSNDNTDDENTVVENFQEENPLAQYLERTGYNQQSTAMVNTGESHEMGYFFKPLKKGKINSIVVKLPAADSDLTVRIWDLLANTVIRTETIEVTTANTTITKVITPLELEKNKEYAITMISDNYFKMGRTDLGTTNHPITVGNIKINGSYWSDTTMQNPSFITLIGLYNGECSFNFLQTE